MPSLYDTPVTYHNQQWHIPVKKIVISWQECVNNNQWHSVLMCHMPVVTVNNPVVEEVLRSLTLVEVETP